MNADYKQTIQTFLDLCDQLRTVRQDLNIAEAKVLREVPPGKYMVGEVMVEVQEKSNRAEQPRKVQFHRGIIQL